jgi:hypothetical protein
MYFDLAKLMEKAQSMIPAGQMQAASFSPKDMPFESLIAASRIEGQLTGALSLPFRPDLEDKATWQSLSKLSKATTVANSVPDSALFYLSLNGEIFKTIQQLATKNLPPQKAQQIMQVTALLSSINDVGIGVTNLPGGALFPSVFLLANSNQGEQLRAQLKGILQAQGQSANLPASSWKTKEIEGSSVDYTLSPLGIGAYLTDHEGHLVLGTTETVVRDSLKANAGQSSLLKGVSQEAKAFTLPASQPPLAMMYANFEGVADLVDSLQNNLAMFTGGQSNFDTTQIEALRNIGKVLGTVRVSDSSASVRSVYFQ